MRGFSDKVIQFMQKLCKNQNTRKIGDSFRRRRLSCTFRNDQIAVSQKLFAFRAGSFRRRFIIPHDLRVTLQYNFFFVRTVFLHKGAEPTERKLVTIVGRPLIIRNERRCFDINRLICRPAVERELQRRHGGGNHHLFQRHAIVKRTRQNLFHGRRNIDRLQFLATVTTPSGKVTLVRFVQFLNASKSISIISPLSTTLVSPVQPINALLAIPFPTLVKLLTLK